jgi:ABC-type uncharacterized transport system substrate-binding protein
VWASKCLYISSYHKGYEWDDGILQGIQNTLGDKCALEVFYLDSKRNPDKAWVQWQARKAVKLIGVSKPDVIIAADDNASRYLVMPYLKNKDIPVVFCGINWSMDDYGYPYKNATGMVEVAPAKALIKQLKILQPNIKRGVFLSSDVLSEHKDYRHYKKVFSDNKIKLDSIFVKNFRQWRTQYKKAQRYDFIFLGNNAGINDWYASEAERIVNEYARTISVTTYKWMLPYAAMAFSKLPEEQGSWAAKVALSIIDGADPAQIPVVHNRLWDMWLNPRIIKRLNLKMPYLLYKRAKHY